VPGAVAVSRDDFEGKGFTRMLYDGAAYESYSTGSDLAATVARVLDRASPPPFVVVYWDELDTLEHLLGPYDGAVDLEIDRVVGLFDFAARATGPTVSRRTTVLITADHGVVPIEPRAQVAVESVPEVARHLSRPPTGDRRAGLFTARRGEVEGLASALLESLPPGSKVLPGPEAVRLELFGPPPFHPELLERVGDLVALVPSPAGITYTLPGRARGPRELLGAHGGLEREELLVPLVSGSLADCALGPARP